MRFFRCSITIFSGEKISILAQQLSRVLFGGANFIATSKYQCAGFDLEGNILGCSVSFMESVDGKFNLEIQTEKYEAFDSTPEEKQNQEALLGYILKILNDNGIKSEGSLFAEKHF